MGVAVILVGVVLKHTRILMQQQLIMELK